MEAKYATVFIESWNEVLNSFSSLQLVGVDVLCRRTAPAGKDICVFMGIAGGINGQIYMAMDARREKPSRPKCSDIWR